MNTKYQGIVFQSTRPRGARQIVEPIEYGATVFQSTRPRGARLEEYLDQHTFVVGFNPRARVGRDVREASIYWEDMEFQSTRPRGARHHPSMIRLYSSMFQSTRPRGARHDLA